MLLAACSSKPDVQVFDMSGKPIQGAAVVPISLSINYNHVTTDAAGECVIPNTIQRVKWIMVTKHGYKDSPQIDYNQPKPIRVVLQP